MPALVNINVGSFFNTMGAEGTISWAFASKYSKKSLLISFEDINHRSMLIADRTGLLKIITFALHLYAFKLVYKPQN